MADRKVIQLEDGAGNLYDVKDAEARADIEELDENKAEVDGYYEGLTAGSAEQLISSQMNNDQEPYVFRTAGGSADIGNRKNESIVGGTICWNQLIRNGDFGDGSTSWGKGATNSTLAVSNGEATITLGGDSWNNDIRKAINILAGHKYLISFNAKCSANVTSHQIWVRTLQNIVGKGFTVSTSYTTCSYVFNAASSTNSYSSFVIGYADDMASLTGESFTVDNICIFDLTAMFGSTIADYIYSLEQATAGAGVAWFRKLFPKPYYAYNAGELMSVKAAGMETVGFNQWDEEWEVGDYNTTTGAKKTQADRIRSKNYIQVVPGAVYNFSVAGMKYIYCYDANKTYLRYITMNGTYGYFLLTVPDDCYYITFNMGSQYGTTYNHDICINLSWSGYRNGEYEPYVKRTYPLDSSLELRGIPKLDASNNLYYDGDTYAPDGTVTRRYKVVNLGDYNWIKNGDTQAYTIGITDFKHDFYVSNPNVTCCFIICSKYVTKYGTLDAEDHNMITLYHNASYNGYRCFIEDSAFGSMNASQVKTALNGVYLVYELAEPTTEEADPYQNPQVVDDFGTERFVDAAYEAEDRDVEMPVGHDTDYMANLRDKLQHLPDLGSGNGTYAIVQSNNQLSLTPLTTPTELPDAPTTDGTYALKVTVASGTPTYSWVAST